MPLASQDGQIPSGCELMLPPPLNLHPLPCPHIQITLFTMLEYVAGAFPGPTQALSLLSFSFWYFPCRLQSCDVETCLPYQYSEKRLSPTCSCFITAVTLYYCLPVLVYMMSSCTLMWWDFLREDFWIFCSSSSLQRFRNACDLRKVTVLRFWF